VEVTAEHEVIHGAHMREELDILERSCNSFFGNLRGFEISDLSASEENLPGIRRIDPGDAVKNRSLSSSIRTDDRVDGPFLNFKAYVGQSSDSTK